MNKKLFKNLSFGLVIFGLIFGYAFAANAKLSNKNERKENKAVKMLEKKVEKKIERKVEKRVENKIIKKVSDKIKESKKSDNNDESANKKSDNGENKQKGKKKISKFEVRGIIKSIDKDAKTLIALINKANGGTLREKKGLEEKFSVDANTVIRIKDVTLNFDELVPEMKVDLLGRKEADKLSLIRVNVRTEVREAQGELKSVDTVSRMIKVAVRKAGKIKSIANKDVDIKVFANARIIKAGAESSLDSLKSGERVNLKIIKIGDNLFTFKIVEKGENDATDSSDATDALPTATTTPSTAMTTPETTTISITGSEFSPASVEITKGSKVIFVNNTSSTAQVASDPHPLHTDFPEFGAGPVLQPGESFEFTFTKEMTFKYHDHLNASSSGTVIVK